MTAEKPQVARPALLWFLAAFVGVLLGGALLLVEGQQAVVVRATGALLVLAGVGLALGGWRVGAPERRAARETLRGRGYRPGEQPITWSGHLAALVGLPVASFVVIADLGLARDPAMTALLALGGAILLVLWCGVLVSAVQRLRRLGPRPGAERPTGTQLLYVFFISSSLLLQSASKLAAEDRPHVVRTAGVLGVVTGSVLVVGTALVLWVGRRGDRDETREAEAAR